MKKKRGPPSPYLVREMAVESVKPPTASTTPAYTSCKDDSDTGYLDKDYSDTGYLDKDYSDTDYFHTRLEKGYSGSGYFLTARFPARPGTNRGENLRAKRTLSRARYVSSLQSVALSITCS